MMDRNIRVPASAAERSAPGPAARKPQVLIVVATVCAAVLFGAYRLSAPFIARSKQAELERAVFRVLPGAVRQRAFVRDERGRFVPSTASGITAQNLYAGYDASGQFLGVAIPAQGMGYQDRIGVLYGYDPQQQAIVGLAVLDSRETPGLGARIATDAPFLANFAHLDVRLDAHGTGLAHPIEVVKAGQKQQPWQIDAITGATVSSNAVGALLQRSANEWLPAIVQHREDFLP